jgi:hypothetical protein
MEHLHRLGLNTVTVAGISIDDVPVVFFTDEDKHDHGNRAGAKIQLDNDEQRDGDRASEVALIFAYAVAILFIPTAALMVLHYGRKRRRQEDEEKNSRQKDNEPASEAESEERNSNLKSEEDDEDQSLSGLYSLDLSMYTTTCVPAALNLRSGSNDEIDPTALVSR